MRTYDAATYSDLKKDSTMYMIQSAMLTGDVMGGNTSSFNVTLDGKVYSGRVDADGRVHVSMNGDDMILYKAITSGGRRRSSRRNRNRNRNRNNNTINSRRNRNRNHNRNSYNDYS